MFEFLITEL